MSWMDGNLTMSCPVCRVSSSESESALRYVDQHDNNKRDIDSIETYGTFLDANTSCRSRLAADDADETRVWLPACIVVITVDDDCCCVAVTCAFIAGACRE